MLLTLKEHHQTHLQFLTNQPCQVVQDFCQLASQFAEKGPNLKLYGNAAQKLGSTSDEVRQAVEGLVHLVLEASRNQVTSEELGVTLLALGFTPELRDVLASWILSCPAPLSALRPSTVHYTSLAWRLEANMASRSLLHHTHTQAKVVLLFTLSGGKKVALQATPAVLRHIAQSLEEALAEAGSRHCRRALRSIK